MGNSLQGAWNSSVDIRVKNISRANANFSPRGIDGQTKLKLSKVVRFSMAVPHFKIDVRNNFK
jgi:hypothetical protein